jgi:hypothetical protein
MQTRPVTAEEGNPSIIGGHTVLPRVALSLAAGAVENRTMRSRLALALLSLALPLHAASRDGSHDFDFEIGTWKTHLRRLKGPLGGSSTWVEYEGTSVVRPILDGRANLVELRVDGPAGRIEGLSLRLYDPAAGRWSLNFSNVRTGTLSPPVIGEFKDGRGEFYGADTLDGRAILVRFVISDVTTTSARFEQSFSADGGKTWEVNWVAVDTKVPGS